MKKSILKIMGWAAVALIIPLLGNKFVDGWSWGWNDFLFAWVFWVVMASSILYATKQSSKYKMVIGIVVFLAFASVWAMLATG